MRLTRDELVAELERVAQGDVGAFVKVYNATSKKLYGIIVRILGKGELAEEVLQEVYLRVWMRAGHYRAVQGSPITWLASIARNRALDEVRRRRSVALEDMPELLEVPSEEDIVGRHIEADELRRLKDCLDRLDPLQREIVQLVYFEGLSRQNIAARIGKPETAVKDWLRRGLAKLKVCLDP